MSGARAEKFSNIDFVFLDRDGVINRKPPPGGYITCWEQFELLPGVVEALAALHRSGRRILLATNQRGVALGLFSERQLRSLHQQLQEHLSSVGAPLDAIYCCPHDENQCRCRKPLPGMFEQGFRDFPGAGAENSVMIGDSLCDIEAGARVGMRTIFISDGSSSSGEESSRATALADACATSLSDCVRRYLS